MKSPIFKRMKSTKIGIILLIAFSSVFAEENQDLLKEATELQRNGAHLEAEPLFSRWLKENVNKPLFPEVLEQYFHSVTDLEKAVLTLKELREDCTVGENSKAIFYYLAFAEEMTGNIEKARQSFEFSNMRSTNSADVYNFFHSIRLLIAMGEFERAEAQTKAVFTTSVEPDVKNRSRLYLAYILYLLGREKEGKTFLEEAPLEIQAMNIRDVYFLQRIASLYHLEGLEGRVAKHIENTYGESIEAHLLQENPYVSIGPSLHFYQTTSVSGTTGPDKADDNTVRIQTGIFANRNNASLLVTALADKGFTASIEELQKKEETLFRVVLPWIAADDSQDYIIRLKEQGFEGFLLFK